MARSQSNARRQGTGSRAAPTGRPSLIPDDPLPGWKALLQALFLLGVPIAMLWLLRAILRAVMPELGY